VKNQTPDLIASDKKKLGPGHVQKIEESAKILLVKSRGCENKIIYFGNRGEMLLLTASFHPFPPLRQNAVSSLKSIPEEY
jgi:hypothetical protein